ncbi:MAG: PTS sugar transporter subunit IIA [Solobacterium sp.]|nr:PTS sugar transporter subunit IIA [Solobacterium sp.]
MSCTVVLAGHEKFASALAKTIEFIYGSRDGLITVDMPEPFNQQVYEESLRKAVQEHEAVLILCDLFGGSPFLTSSRILKEYPEKTELLTGVNLGMVLEVMPLLNESSLQDIKRSAKESGMNGIVDIKERMSI